MGRRGIGLAVVLLLSGGAVLSRLAGATAQEAEQTPAFDKATRGLARSGWPCFRGNSRGTALARGKVTAVPASWTMETLPALQGGGGIYGSPAIAEDGTVYVGADHLYALDGNTGRVKWSFYIAGGIFATSPAIGPDGLIYTGCDGEYLYVLDPSTGAVKRSVKLEAYSGSSPTLGRNGLVYIGSHDGKIHAFRALDGKPVWSCDTHSGIDTSPLLDNDGGVYCASGGNVYAANATTGRVRWKYAGYQTYPIGSPALGADGTVYVGMIADGPGRDKRGEVVALDPFLGAVKWKFPTGAHIYSTPAIGSDGTVYIGCGDHNCYALNGKTGKLKWKFVTGDRIQGSPAIGGDGTVYIGSCDKKLYALNGATGAKKWEYKTGGALQGSPAIGANGLIYVGSMDGIFYAIRPPGTKDKAGEGVKGDNSPTG